MWPRAAEVTSRAKKLLEPEKRVLRFHERNYGFLSGCVAPRNTDLRATKTKCEVPKNEKLLDRP